MVVVIVVHKFRFASCTYLNAARRNFDKSHNCSEYTSLYDLCVYYAVFSCPLSFSGYEKQKKQNKTERYDNKKKRVICHEREKPARTLNGGYNVYARQSSVVPSRATLQTPFCAPIVVLCSPVIGHWY